MRLCQAGQHFCLQGEVGAQIGGFQRHTLGKNGGVVPAGFIAVVILRHAVVVAVAVVQPPVRPFAQGLVQPLALLARQAGKVCVVQYPRCGKPLKGRFGAKGTMALMLLIQSGSWPAGSW